MHKIPKIALDGGPGAGKTTARTYLMQKLGDAGFHVVFVPEAATMLMEGGITRARGVVSPEVFQRSIIRLSLALEDVFDRAAADVQNGRSVILCDRGIPHGLAYAESRESFELALKEFGLGFVRTRDERYDAVLHLRTAAFGAEAFYTLENNATRFETLEEARERDEKILEAWSGHPHLRVIDNAGSLDAKLKRVLTEVCKVLGIPEPVETERKYLIHPNFSIHGVGTLQKVEIEQVYLVSNSAGEELRLRKRSQWGESVYFKTLKRPGPDPSSRIETEEFITAAEYEFGRQFQQPGSRVIRKCRYCFVYDNQYFELDEFTDPMIEHFLLEIELADPGQEVRLPPFFNVVREVTGESAYSNYALAMR